MSRRDVIVIGGGHNGLVAAALLARRGLDVLVVERRERPGGIADLLPTAGRLRRSVIDTLGLRSHGLEFVRPEIRMLALRDEGDPIPFWARSKPSGHYLFDRRDDPGEERNLAGEAVEQDLAQQLRAVLQALEAPASQLERLGLS